jgi:hypothetical protein
MLGKRRRREAAGRSVAPRFGGLKAVESHWLWFYHLGYGPYRDGGPERRPDVAQPRVALTALGHSTDPVT